MARLAGIQAEEGSRRETGEDSEDQREATIPVDATVLGAREGSTDEILTQLLMAYVGADVSRDRRLLESATRMWNGERVAVFGERGSSPEDLVGILVRQPSFFGRRIENLGELLLGSKPPQADVMQWSLKLALDPGQFHKARNAWVLRAMASDDMGKPRRKSDLQIVNGIYVDGLGRMPRGQESADALKLMAEVGDRELALGLVVAGILGRGRPRPEPPQEAAAVTLVRAAFRGTLARSPRKEEAAAAGRLLADVSGDTVVLRRLLLGSSEYLWY